MGALSEFAVPGEDGRWSIKQPKLFGEDEMITRTVNQLRAQNSDPMSMGRETAHDAVRIYPQALMTARSRRKLILVWALDGKVVGIVAEQAAT